jgi:hypothetical protein
VKIGFAQLLESDLKKQVLQQGAQFAEERSTVERVQCSVAAVADNGCYSEFVYN